MHEVSLKPLSLSWNYNKTFIFVDRNVKLVEKYLLFFFIISNKWLQKPNICRSFNCDTTLELDLERLQSVIWKLWGLYSNDDKTCLHMWFLWVEFVVLEKQIVLFLSVTYDTCHVTSLFSFLCISRKNNVDLQYL